MRLSNTVFSISALAVLASLSACAAPKAPTIEAQNTMPRYGASKAAEMTANASEQDMDTKDMDAKDMAAGPVTTADTLMASLIADAATTTPAAPDMITYARCVGISDYMTAHSATKDRKDWADDTRKFEAKAAQLPDYDAQLFASEREITVSKMAEGLRALKMAPDAAVTKSRTKALGRDVAACVHLAD